MPVIKICKLVSMRALPIGSVPRLGEHCNIKIKWYPFYSPFYPTNKYKIQRVYLRDLEERIVELDG